MSGLEGTTGDRSATRFRRIVGAMAVVGLALLVVPVVLMVVTVFSDGAGDRLAEIDGVLLDRLVNSIVLAGGATLLTLLIGIPFALFLHRARFPGRRFLGLLYVLPLFVPPHVHTIAWMRVFGNTGYLSGWLTEQGVDFDIRRGFLEFSGEATFYPGPMVLLASSFWPFIVLLASAGLSQLDPRREEAALLAVGRRRMLLGVTLPAIRLHLLAGAFFVFIFSLGCYPIPILLDTKTVMQEIWFASSNKDPLVAAAKALPVVGVCLLALATVVWMAGRTVVGGSATASRTPASLRPSSWMAGVFGWGTLVVSAGWPFFSLIWKAGAPATYQRGWGMIGKNIINSLILASSTGVVVAVVGTFAALWITTLRRRTGALVESTALLAFAFPPLAIGAAVNTFWARVAEPDQLLDRWIYNGPGAPILAFSALFLPFAIRSVASSLRRVPTSAIEAGLVGGRSRAAVLRTIVMPQIVGGIVVAALLGYVLTLAELAAGLVACPGNWQTAQVRIFNMIHFGYDSEVAAMCLILAGFGIVPCTLYVLLSGRRVEVL